MTAYQCRTNHRHREIVCREIAEGVEREEKSTLQIVLRQQKRLGELATTADTGLYIRKYPLSSVNGASSTGRKCRTETNFQGTVALYHLTLFSCCYYL